MEYINSNALISTEWVRHHRDDPNTTMIDASWYHPSTGRDAYQEYLGEHIPGARFWALDDIADEDNPLPHMLPSPELFEAKMSDMGILNITKVVVYDAVGLMSAARVWWMLRYFGHDNVGILDGGLPKWKAEGGKLKGGPAYPRQGTFKANPRPELVRNLEDMWANIESKASLVVDARGKARFDGTELDLWEGRRPGHIPGSLNLPFDRLIDPETKTLLPADTLAERYAEAGLDVTKPIVTSCGSGVTASVLAFGLYLLGHENVPVYDGSWAEWGLREDTPVET